MHEENTAFIFTQYISTGKEPDMGPASRCREPEQKQVVAKQLLA